jgi:hypothetical protein
MNHDSIFWLMVALLVALPLLLAAGGKLLFRRTHRRLVPGIGSAIFIGLCWLLALGIVLYRIGTFG